MKTPIVVPWTRYEFPEMINNRGYRIGVEIGVEYGCFSYYLLKHSSLATLHSVDPWAKARNANREVDHTISMLSQFCERSQIHRMLSTDAAAVFAADKTPIDFVYCDGCHRTSSVTADLAAYWPLLRPGGCFAGHDYIDIRRNGVIGAVDQFAEQNPDLQLYLTRESEWKSWFFFKPRTGV